MIDASSLMNGDPWSSAPTVSKAFDRALVERIRLAPVEDRTDIDVATGLLQLVHDQLQKYGTDNSQTLDDDEIGVGIVALRAVLRRVAVPFDLPFRNFITFRSYWMKHEASGSWQARRDILNELLEPLHLRLVRLEEQTLEALATPISPRAEVGWPAVDEEIRELRRRFATAVTAQDYRAIGTNCVGVLESLGQTVYDPNKHLREGETAPPRDNTNMRICRYIEDALPGRHNEDLRGLANKAAALAHRAKHAPTAIQRDAGIATDSVILLANMLRRLDEVE